MKSSLERGLGEAIENQGVGLRKRFPRWSGIVPSTFCFVPRGPSGTSVLPITTWVPWKGPPQRQEGEGSVQLTNVFRLKTGLLGLIRADEPKLAHPRDLASLGGSDVARLQPPPLQAVASGSL